MSRWALAPAKVNLFLHVGARRADGFHSIASLMVFADVGDRLSVRPAVQTRFAVGGPFADHAPTDTENLAIRAVLALAAPNTSSFDELRMRRSTSTPGEDGESASVALTLSPSKGEGVSLLLDKRIPAGAGLGGGSADAAAALRLVGGGTSEVAALLGSDVPPCVTSRPVLARGRGDRLELWPEWPQLPAVLVWPGEGVSTGDVYAAFDETPLVTGPEGPLIAPPQAWEQLGEAIKFLRTCRNDLEVPAIRLQPLIGEVLEALRSEPEPLLARMSGSGSACFALCRTIGDAEALAERLAQRYPGWWVRACTLGAPPLWGE